MRSYTGVLANFTDHRYDASSGMYLYQDAEIGGKRFAVLRVPQQLDISLHDATPSRPVTIFVLNNLVGGIKNAEGATYILRAGNHRAMLFISLCLVGVAIPIWKSGGLLFLLPAAFFAYLAWGIWGFKRLPNAKKL